MWHDATGRRFAAQGRTLLALELTGPDRGRGTGPVATLCMNEISKFCPEVEHAFGQVRNCLNAHSGELGEACTIALENTSPRWHN